MDLAADAAHVVVSYRERGVVRLFSRADGQFVKELEVHRPAATTMQEEGLLLAAGGGRVVAISLADGTERTVVEDEAIGDPRAISVDQAAGQLLVATGHRVWRYALATGRLLEIHGREGGRRFGRFEPGDMRDILGLASDGAGGFFVAEGTPRRVARFQGGLKKPVREWFGGVSWGAMFTVDPQRPTVGYGIPNDNDRHFMRFEMDYESQTWRPTHLFETAYLPAHWTRTGRWQIRRWGDGRMWLMYMGEVNPGIAPVVIEIDEAGDMFRPASAMGRVWWHQHAGGRAAWFDEADAHVEAKTGRRVKQQHFNAFSWLDRNGDGRLQPAEELTLRGGAPGWGHTDMDDLGNLYIAGAYSSGAGEDGRAVMWHRIPPRSDSDGTPAWDWADAVAVRAERPIEFDAWRAGQPSGIRLGPDGSVYQLWSSHQPGERGQGRYGNGWPHLEIGSARLFRWSGQGDLLWAVGQHAAYKGAERPGQIAQPRAILGLVGDRILIHDRAGRVCAAWTTDGLVAGSMFDRHVNDGLPREWLYHISGAVYPKRYLMGDDHIGGNVVGLSDGRLFWMTPGQDSTPVYELHDVTAGVARRGEVRVDRRPAEAEAGGSGLVGRYFEGEQMVAPAVLERLDPGVWFGDRHLPVYSLSNEPFFGRGQWPVVPEAFAVRWEGTIEARFAEDYRFIVETSGRSDANHRHGAKIRLWIDDKLIIDHWDNVARPPAHVRTKLLLSERVRMLPGQRVGIRLAFSSHGSDRPHVHLMWESASQERQHVPASLLYER